MDYNPNDRDQICGAYLEMGPCQPCNHVYPQKKIEQSLRWFNQAWFDEYPNWIEYNIAKDAVFSLCCYLFRPDNGGQAGVGSFVSVGFSSWKKKHKLQTHVGGHNSAHNEAWSKCLDLLGQKELIQEISPEQSDHAQNEFRTFLKASIDSVLYLLRQGFLFCDPEEYLFDVSNEGLFLELLKFVADKNEHIKAVLAWDDAPQNLELAATDLQKDIVSVAAFETINEMIRDLGEGPFSIWIDETCDFSNEDQMTVVLRYADRKGQVIERFLGIGHVPSTGAFSRKTGVDELLSRLGLSISRLCGQGYGMADNVREELNGLKILILEENPCTYYFHSFAYKLQSALVDLAATNIEITIVFYCVSRIVNAVGAPCNVKILESFQVAKA